MSNYAIHQGDVTDVLRTFPDNHFSCSITDPPYGLGETPDMAELLAHWLEDKHYDTKKGFMGKAWDVVPGPAVWKEVLRVLRPGGILMAFGGTRTADLLSIAIRLAGFERWDEIQWITGSGFPKGHDISKAIDKEAGQERKVIAEWRTGFSGTLGGKAAYGGLSGEDIRTTSEPATDAAKVWAGYNVSLKPSHEPILCFRKPRTATYAQTAMLHGTACLNIDGTRIAGTVTTNPLVRNAPGYQSTGLSQGTIPNGNVVSDGRWPANVIFDQAAADLLDEMSGELTSGARKDSPRKEKAIGGGWTNSGTCEASTGGASRYFAVLPTFIYQAKAASSERSQGLTGHSRQRDASRNADQPSMNGGEGNPYNRGAVDVKNFHPCVKPVTLTEYLARLIIPPKEYRADARILVPFSGSGSEMIGALLAGWLNVDGIEIDPDYIAIAEQRLAHWQDELSVEPRRINGRTTDYADSPLFAELAA